VISARTANAKETVIVRSNPTLIIDGIAEEYQSVPLQYAFSVDVEYQCVGELEPMEYPDGNYKGEILQRENLNHQSK